MRLNTPKHRTYVTITQAGTTDNRKRKTIGFYTLAIPAQRVDELIRQLFTQQEPTPAKRP